LEVGGELVYLVRGDALVGRCGERIGDRFLDISPENLGSLQPEGDGCH
jgi:hypothetical protein